MGLVALAVSYALRRWSGWRPAALLAAGAGGVALGVAMAPVAWPFFVTRRELGLERAASEALDRSANVLTYLTTTGTWLASLVPISFASETTLFPVRWPWGSPCWRSPGSGRTGARAPRGWPERLVSAATIASLVLAVLTVGGRARAPRCRVDPTAVGHRPAASRSWDASSCGTRSPAGGAGGRSSATGA